MAYYQIVLACVIFFLDSQVTKCFLPLSSLLASHTYKIQLSHLIILENQTDELSINSIVWMNRLLVAYV